MHLDVVSLFSTPLFSCLLVEAWTKIVNFILFLVSVNKNLQELLSMRKRNLLTFVQTWIRGSKWNGDFE
jgi:hypothetical protein